MHHGVTACAADEPLSTVALVMADHRVHCVAVAGISAGGSPSDLGADRRQRLRRRRPSEGALTARQRDRGPDAIAVREPESLDRAAALMVEHQRHHIVVVGDSGIPSGIVSTLDVAGVLSAGS